MAIPKLTRACGLVIDLDDYFLINFDSEVVETVFDITGANLLGSDPSSLTSSFSPPSAI